MVEGGDWGVGWWNEESGNVQDGWLKGGGIDCGVMEKDPR